MDILEVYSFSNEWILVVVLDQSLTGHWCVEASEYA